MSSRNNGWTQVKGTKASKNGSKIGMWQDAGSFNAIRTMPVATPIMVAQQNQQPVVATRPVKTRVISAEYVLEQADGSKKVIDLDAVIAKSQQKAAVRQSYVAALQKERAEKAALREEIDRLQAQVAVPLWIRVCFGDCRPGTLHPVQRKDLAVKGAVMVAILMAGINLVAPMFM